MVSKLRLAGGHVFEPSPHVCFPIYKFVSLIYCESKRLLVVVLPTGLCISPHMGTGP